jgi:hypothetical protein|tara:strand:+ start:1432 stop:1617 length:186 start_codon:yes stop_codon:yes gene_type:complete
VKNPWSEESRKRARKKWRQSERGKAWDKAYLQRPEVKARRHEYYIKRLIKECKKDDIKSLG